MSEGEIQGKEQNKLTEQNKSLKDLVFQSFRFSQGDLMTQSHMLQWLRTKGYFDAFDFPEEIPDYIQELAIPHKHKSIADAHRLRELGIIWTQLRSDKPQFQQFSAEEILEPILTGMIRRDSIYQKFERPNRQTAKEIIPDSSNDPHASFVRKYIINAHPTGNRAFDELFRDAAIRLQQYRTAPITSSNPDDALSDLHDLGTLYRIRHPGYTFFPPKE